MDYPYSAMIDLEKKNKKNKKLLPPLSRERKCGVIREKIVEVRRLNDFIQEKYKEIQRAQETIKKMERELYRECDHVWGEDSKYGKLGEQKCRVCGVYNNFYRY